MQALQRVAFQADKLCGSDMLATIYRRSQYNPATMKGQDDSLLMALPTELRVMIYRFAFSSPTKGTANPLALLSTCRQIHGEAIEVALRIAQFYLNPKIGFAFRSRLRSLGPLKQHLRRVKVQIPFDDLTFERVANPFTLIELPLDKLEIKIGMPDSMTFFASTRIYPSILSAILYEEACATNMGGTMRRVNLKLRLGWATQAQIYSMLGSMRAKSVVVTCKNRGDDVFWSAFSQYGLSDSTCFVLHRKSEDIRGADETKPHRWMSFHSNDEEDVLEFGQVPCGFEIVGRDVRTVSHG